MITPVGISVADYVNASLTGARSHMRISIPGGSVALEDDDIEQGGISISSLLNSSTNLKIGEAISQQISIPLLNTDALTGIIWTAEFKVEYGIEVNGDTYWITLGYFTGVKPNLYVGDQVVNFTAFDRMQKFERIADDWLDSLTYPMTVLQMLKSLCDFCGVGWRAGDELPNIKNRSYSTAPVVQRGLTCREILAAIAEACGCYAKIDNEGYCKLVWFANHTSDYSLTGDEEFSVRIFKNSIGKTWEGLEDYRWIDLEGLTWSDLEGMRNQFRIDGIRVTITEDDVGVLYPDGMVGNIYQIVDNPFLMTSNDSDVVNYIVPIYTRLNNIGGYIPVNVTSIGCALIEAGDIVNIEADGEVVSMPIFSKNATWNGALMDMIETTGDATTEEVPRDVSEKLYEGGRYHKWKNTVDELYSELYDPTTGDVSILKQTASELGLSAEGIDIQGGKYVNIGAGSDLNIEGGQVNITSGGNLIINSPYFIINSVDKEMLVGDIHYMTNGIWRQGYINGSKFFYTVSGEVDLDERSPDSDASAAGVNLGTITGLNDASLALYLKKKSGLNTYRKLLFLRYYVDSDTGLPDYTKPAYLIGSGNSVTIGAANSPFGLAYINQLGSNELSAGRSKVAEGYFINIYVDTLRYVSLVQSSSRDIKHDIQPLLSVGEKLDRLEPVSFIYDEDENEKTRYGLIYEDTVEALPEICTDDESDKAINYVELIPMLLKEIQDLRARVKALEEEREREE